MLKRLFKAPPRLNELKVIDFKDPSLGLNSLLVRSDKDLGGFSSASLDVKQDKDGAYGRFEGNLSLDLPEDKPDIVRLGFAMFRTKDLDPGFLGLSGPEFHDWSEYRQLALRVRGDRRKYFVNIQADTPYPTDLYQHRLFLKTPGEWETVTVPLSSFILTNGGVIQQQQPLNPQQVKTVGLSILDGQYGPFGIDIDWVKAIATGITQTKSEPGIGLADGMTLVAVDALTNQ